MLEKKTTGLDIIFKDISALDQKEKGELKSNQNYRVMNKTYNIERNVLKLVIQALKQHLVALNTKMQR